MNARSEPSADAPPFVPWVESGVLEARLDAIGADAATRAFARELAETGVAVITLDSAAVALLDRAAADAEPLVDTHGARVQDLWRRSPAVRALALDAQIVRLLGDVYGRRAFPFQTLSFKYGSEQNVHVDAMHFHSHPPRFMCGVWIALEDVQPGAGALEYYPGSHKGPVLSMADVGVSGRRSDLNDYWNHYEPALNRRLEGMERRHAMLKKGQALVWSANLAHGGAQIERRGTTRRSLVTHYFFEDCFYYTPLESEPEADRWAVRLPPDVRTGGWMWPRRDGRRAAVPLKQVARAALDRLRRRTPRLS